MVSVSRQATLGVYHFFVALLITVVNMCPEQTLSPKLFQGPHMFNSLNSHKNPGRLALVLSQF